MRRRTFLLSALATTAAVTGCTPEPVPPTTAPTSVPPTPDPLVPAASLRTRWSTDPFSRGSVSFLRPGGTPEDRLLASRSVGDRLFFAGEAYSPDRPGTVQGALTSGTRAAAEIRALDRPGERVAVVGAGIAGAAAARALADSGHEVLIIEGRDRTGGRIRTISQDAWPFPLELGAGFASAAPESALGTLLRVGDAVTTPFLETAEFRSREGSPLASPRSGRAAVETAATWSLDNAPSATLAEALIDSGAGQVAATALTGMLSEAEALGTYLSGTLALATGSSPRELSAAFGADPVLSPPAADAELVFRYQSIVDDLIGPLDLLLSSPVSRIAFDSEGARLRLSTGESLSADRVVLTVPHVALLDDAVTVEPGLPISQRMALANIGMGAVEKLYLRFSEPFWSTDATMWTVVGGPGPVRHWLNLLPATGEPVLLGLVGGDEARRAARLDDDALIEQALATLTAFADS